MPILEFDLENWVRKEHFLHYLKEVPCRYGMTVKLDITSLLPRLKDKGTKLYPAIIYALANCVNRHEEFRMVLDDCGKLCVFDRLDPSYTIFHNYTETFSVIWTRYSEDFSSFQQSYLEDVKSFSSCKKLFAKPVGETFDISCIPWCSFTEFHLDLPDAKNFLLPIFTIGGYTEENGRLMLPLSAQVHHAVCDGFHLSRFFTDCQKIIDSMEI